MKRKLLLLLTFCFVAALSTLLFTGCPEGTNEENNAPIHNYGEWVIEKASTCQQVGQRYRVCTDEGCNNMEWEAIPMREHTYEDYEITYIGHTIKCSVCENVKVQGEHNFKDNYCEICTYEKGTTAGLRFELNAETNTYTVYNGNWVDSFPYIIYIPSKYCGLPVTAIGKNAFYNYSWLLLSVSIPNSVTSIGDAAFASCHTLTSINIPDSVTSIGDYAFTDCTSLETIIIPNSVTSIGSSAFSDCSKLTSVTIPNSVTSIDYRAFYNCASLENIIIPDSVTSIGNRAFSDCTSLTSIIIPDSVTSIGSSAFSGCDSLTIYCEAEEKPNGWDEQWNYLYYHETCPVVWGYKGEN